MNDREGMAICPLVRESMAIGHLETVVRTLQAVYDDQEIDQGQVQGMLDQIGMAIDILKGDPS